MLISLEDEAMREARDKVRPYLDNDVKLTPKDDNYPCVILILNRLEDAATLVLQDVVDGETMKRSLHQWLTRYWALTEKLPLQVRSTYTSLTELRKLWGEFTSETMASKPPMWSKL